MGSLASLAYHSKFRESPVFVAYKGGVDELLLIEKRGALRVHKDGALEHSLKLNVSHMSLFRDIKNADFVIA